MFSEREQDEVFSHLLNSVSFSQLLHQGLKTFFDWFLLIGNHWTFFWVSEVNFCKLICKLILYNICLWANNRELYCNSTFFLPSPVPGARWPPGVILYPTPLTNIVIMSPIHFIFHCPLGQHICAFMHWGHDYHSMFLLHLLFAEAGREHHLGTELMTGGNSLLKRILWTLCHWMTSI